MTITLTREEAQQVLDAMDSVAVEEHLCNAAHHPKKDQHGINDPCPVAKRFDEAIKTLRAQLAQPEPKPVAWMSSSRHIYHSREGAKLDGVDKVAPVYVHPPQREWQGLTAYEIQELHLANPNWGDFACAIEAKLKEKNT